MADKQISQLEEATLINGEDLLVLQQGNAAKKVTGATLLKYMATSNSQLEAKMNGEIFLSPSVETERVADGTMIKNPLWLNKCAMAVGYGYREEDGIDKIILFGVLGYKPVPKSRKKLYRLYYKDSESAPFELTPENAPGVSEFSNTSNTIGVYKWRVTVSNVQDHLDFRLCCSYYDTNGVEEERIYSEQYRYTINNDRTLSRTRFNTAVTDPTHIIDAGFYKLDASMNTTYNYFDNKTNALLPLVSDPAQPVQYRFIAPDSYFENAPYGLAIVAVAGDKTRYISGSFFKAEDKAAELKEDITTITAKTLVGSPALTERVADGTLLKNQLWLDKCVAVVGYCYDSTVSKTYLYSIFGTNVPEGGSQKSYNLIAKDAETEVELTVEDAPISSEISGATAFYTCKTNISNVEDHFDYRVCRVLYDSNGNEIERIYSAQYRYTVSNNSVTRARFNTATQDESYIIDLGVVVANAPTTITFNAKITANRTILPLVSTPQTYEYRFIIPDSMFSNAPYGLCIAAVNGIGDKYISSNFFKADDTVVELQKQFTGEIVVGSPALTERVEGGTLLKNQLWANKIVSHVGFAYDQAEAKIYFYSVFAYAYRNGWTNKSYRIVLKDSADPERELTLADTDYVSEITGAEWIMKYRVGSTTINHHADIRYCRVIYDNNGDEVETIYSAQYRYVIENGVVTRTRFNTAPTDPSHIIDIGLLKNNDSVAESFGYADRTISRAIQPLVSTVQTAAFQFIIPDSMFNGTAHGLSVIALTGDLNKYVCTTFYKAKPIVVEDYASTDVTLSAEADTRYKYGELDSLEITSLPSVGIVNVIFQSGSTATVLVLPNTVKMPGWFSVPTNSIVMISIVDGVYGSVQTWDS